ncbi:hypothetical protein PR048_025682 [Dryococelus australis]|uniref:Uncharacterized protein n=1 Tax=Dryococelus australis TaxID=614101 RepID=A0ABQ9GJ81_9NEOP|nr:hypothetical protein PR048_025682 [Dryococelus australis]
MPQQFSVSSLDQISDRVSNRDGATGHWPPLQVLEVCKMDLRAHCALARASNCVLLSPVQLLTTTVYWPASSSVTPRTIRERVSLTSRTERTRSPSFSSFPSFNLFVYSMPNHLLHMYYLGARSLSLELYCSISIKAASQFAGRVLSRLPPRRTGFNPRPGHRISASGNRAGRCRWSVGFLGDLPFPPPLHSGAAPYSLQSPSSVLKTSLLRATQLSSLFSTLSLTLDVFSTYHLISGLGIPFTFNSKTALSPRLTSVDLVSTVTFGASGCRRCLSGADRITSHHDVFGGQGVDYQWPVEFQCRESPHLQTVVWLNFGKRHRLSAVVFIPACSRSCITRRRTDPWQWCTRHTAQPVGLMGCHCPTDRRHRSGRRARVNMVAYVQALAACRATAVRLHVMQLVVHTDPPIVPVATEEQCEWEDTSSNWSLLTCRSSQPE